MQFGKGQSTRIKDYSRDGKKTPSIKKKSTATLGIQLQSIIARALDGDEYVGMASLDLSSAFEVVDIGLLLKRLGVIGVPADMVALIGIWLRKRIFYVEVNGQTSNLKKKQIWNRPRINFGSYFIRNLFITPFRSD